MRRCHHHLVFKGPWESSLPVDLRFCPPINGPEFPQAVPVAGQVQLAYAGFACLAGHDS